MHYPKNILIFRTGQLGDTLVSVPALRAIREHFHHARLTLLYDTQVGKKYVSAREVLDGTGLIDHYLSYTINNDFLGQILRPVRMLVLLGLLRIKRFDALVYLLQSRRQPQHVVRDVKFFGLAGIRQFIGTKGFYSFPKKVIGEPLPHVPHESELILARLTESGIPVPSTGKVNFNLNIGKREQTSIDQWLKTLPFDGKRLWIAVGPGSKMPAKKWPSSRYWEVVQRLIDQFNVWPVIFGGPEDAPLGESLVSQWNCGYVAAGHLTVREAIAAMKRCTLYLGNDCGVMHMAVAAGLKCVAIFSSRDFPGKWYPYGDGHIILRSTISCEGCMLKDCTEKKLKCILSISEDDVVKACTEILEGKSEI